MKILIKDAYVLKEDYSIELGCIGIEDDKILWVGELQEDFTPDHIIDGKNHFAIPGMVNAHTHASMTLLRSYADDMELMDWLNNKIWPIEAKMKEKDIRVGSQLALLEMVRGGTTTFADMYGPCMESVAEETIQAGLRGVLSRGAIGLFPSGEKILEDNVELYKNWHNTGDGRIQIWMGVHAPYTCPPEFCEKAFGYAMENDMNIHIHMSETKAEIQEIWEKYHKRPFKYIADTGLFKKPAIAAHCVWLEEEDFDIIKEYNISPVHNPGSNMKLASGVSPVEEMLSRGINVALGTDGTSSNNNLDMLEEIRLAALLHKVNTLNPLAVPAKVGLEMGTINGAKALQLDKVGLIKAGWKADIILYDLNRPEWCPKHDLLSLLVYSAPSSSVDTVLCNGKILMEKGELKTMDQEKILYEAEECAFNLTRQ